uniref:Poly(A) RNA polymerase mitochondrial-like central palm domain-containing protein n=1 Tax=Meloidogyne enterolobii TaxID=390850 RepID=A0A6V7YA96_MELEN|nr:unnamed protein product [Meloidogyne enterolobii]
MYKQQKIEIHNPTLFITNYIPTKLRAFLVAKRIPATVYVPNFWRSSLIGNEIQLKNEVKTVVVLNKDYEEGLIELMKKLKQIAVLSNIDVFWFLKHPNSRYIQNIVGDNIVTLEDKEEDWPEMIREMAHKGIDFEAGNRARVGELPRKRRNSRESFYKGYQKFERGERRRSPSRKRERSMDVKRYREDFNNINWNEKRQKWGNREKEVFTYRVPAKRRNYEKEDYEYFNKNTKKNYWEEGKESNKNFWEKKEENNKEGRNREIKYNRAGSSKGSLDEEVYSQSTSNTSKGLEENYQIKEKYCLPQNFLEEIRIIDKEIMLNKLIEKNAKEILDENWQIILEKEYYEIKKFLEERIDIKIQLFGSTLSNLCTQKSDIDIAVFESDIKNIGILLKKIAKELKIKYGADKVHKENLIIQAKIPLLEMQIDKESNRITIQITIENETGVINSLHIRMLTEIEPKLKYIWMNIKKWAEINNVIDSKNGRFAAYTLLIMVNFYLLSLSKPAVPNIWKIIEEERNYSEINHVDLGNRIFENIGESFENTEYGTARLFAGFFKFMVDIDFDKYSISNTEENWIKDKNTEKYPVVIENPFNTQQNSARSVKKENWEDIKEKFTIANNKIIQGLNRELFHELIGNREICEKLSELDLQKEEEILKEDENEETIENIDLEKVEKELFKENEEDLEDEKTKEEKSQNKCKKNKAWVNKGKTYKLGTTLGLIILINILTLMNSAIAVRPMICHHLKKSNLIKFKIENSECKQVIKLLNKNVLSGSMDIFKPNTIEFSFYGWKCVAIKQAVDYRTDFLGYSHQKAPEQKIIKITPEECKNWINFKKCEYGEITKGSDKELHTGNSLNLEYSWWKIGWQKATVVNCFITQSLLIGQPGKITIDSPTEEVKHCEFMEEECNLKDGAAIIWEKNNDISEIFDKRMCKYQKIGHFSGNYSNGIWYSIDMQRSLIFEENAER